MQLHSRDPGSSGPEWRPARAARHCGRRPEAQKEMPCIAETGAGAGSLLHVSLPRRCSQLTGRDIESHGPKGCHRRPPRYPARRPAGSLPRRHRPFALASQARARQCRPCSTAVRRARSWLARNAWHAPPVPCPHLNAAGGLLMTTSTRRFCCRPAAESLSATGSLRPLPDATSRRRANPLSSQIRFHRLSAALGERLVVVFTTHAVRVALDGHTAIRVFVEERGQFVQIARRARLQVGLAGGEQHIAERQYQTAIRGLGMQSINLSL